MKLFTRAEIVKAISHSGAVPGVITSYAGLIKSLQGLEFDVTVNEVRALMLQVPHPDTLMGVDAALDRGAKYIHAPNEDRKGDDTFPDGYQDRLNAYLVSIGREPESVK